MVNLIFTVLEILGLIPYAKVKRLKMVLFGFSYQVPPLVVGKTGVVVSPLISLMQDQVRISFVSFFD